MSFLLKDIFKRKKQTPKLPPGLSPREKKAVLEIIRKAENKGSVPHTAQESIPFIQMFPDGICKVTKDYYTRTIEFEDINYQLALESEQHAIFDEWCSFLNFFDSSIHFELSFMNLTADADEAKRLYGISFGTMDDIKNMDAVILAVAHDAFAGLNKATVDGYFNSNNKKN